MVETLVIILLLVLLFDGEPLQKQNEEILKRLTDFETSKGSR